MPNRRYEAGARAERSIVNKLRRKGWIAARSAGSHSPVDVWSYNEKLGKVCLYQLKLGRKAGALLSQQDGVSVKFFLLGKFDIGKFK